MKFSLILGIFGAWLSALVSTDETSSTSDSQLGNPVLVASVSFEPVKLDLVGNANLLEELFRRAAAGGAKIAVAPEGALDGYIVNEIISGQIQPERMKEVAIPLDSPEIGRFQNLARELEICMVFGFAELVRDSETQVEDVYNTAVFIDPEGRISGTYRKMLFAEGYDSSWWFNRLGAESRAFNTPYGRCGILICNDRWNPSLAKILALDGAQFLAIPAFGSTSLAQDEAVLERSVENGIPVIEANVGVSLIACNNRIVAVERRKNGVTFAEIDIPVRGERDIAERDRLEAEFLQWRSDEMQKRLARHLENLKAD
jgi:predicted amidohydrolase